MKKIFILFFLTLFLSSCSSIKRVGKDDLLLKQNTIVVDEKKNTNSDLNELLVQKPNIRTLGLPLSLYFYNLGDKNKPNTLNEWGIKKPKTYNFIKNVFSEKQSISYANSMIGLNNWFLKNGQAPVIIKDEKITKTINNLTAYHKNNGYFRVKAQSTIEVQKNKKAIVNYTIDKGRPTFLDSIITNIKSPVLDSLYQSQKSLSFLKKGDQFKEVKFIKEASRITNLYRNNGIYHFTENDLGYYNIDSSYTNNYKTNVDLVIFDKKRVVKKNGDYELKLFDILKLRKINVYTDYSFNKKNNPYPDSINYEGITLFFYGHEK